MGNRAKLSHQAPVCGIRSQRQDDRAKRTVTVLAAGAAVWPLVAGPLAAGPAAAAATAPPVPSPATVLTIFPWAGSMEDELQGRVCQAPNNCVQIDQSLWDPNGLAIIDATIDATTGTKVVFSYSEGARSVTDWLAEHADDPDAPPPDELSFVLIGNPTRAHGGSGRDVMPQTQYQVIDISRQYDPASDFPDRPLNLFALLNSLAAFTVIHTDYENVDMYDPANIVWTEGNTTYVFVPTENLPLLEPLRQLGLTDLADALNGPLKELVERGYDRSYLPTADEQLAARSALAPAPAPNDLDRPYAGVIDSLAVESASDAGDDADVNADVDVEEEEPSTSGAREADEDDTDADDTGAATGDATQSPAVGSEKDATNAITDDETSDRTTESSGDDTSERAASGKERNSSSSTDSDA